MRVERRRGGVRGWWVILVVAVLLGAAVGYAGATLKKPTYESTAQLSWDPASLRYTNASAYVPDSVSLGLQIDTQALSVLSDTVVDRAARDLGMTSSDIRKAVTVTASATSTQITVSAVAPSARQARDIASDIVKGYQQKVSSSFSAQYTAQAKALQTPIEALQQQINGLPATGTLASDLSQQLATLQAQQSVVQAQAVNPATPLSTIRNADLSTSPTGPSAKTLAVVGAVLGLLVGLAVLGLLLTTRSSRVRAREGADFARVRGEYEVV